MSKKPFLLGILVGVASTAIPTYSYHMWAYNLLRNHQRDSAHLHHATGIVLERIANGTYAGKTIDEVWSEVEFERIRLASRADFQS